MVRRRRRDYAFSIAEMAVVFSILMVLLALVALYFAQGQRYISDLSSYTSLQRDASATLQKMVGQMEYSTSRYFKVAPNEKSDDPPTHAYFLSSLPVTDGEPAIRFDPTTNMVVWKKWIGYYHDPDQKKIYEVAVPLKTATSNLSSEPFPRLSYNFLLKSNPKPVGRGITEMSMMGLPSNKPTVISINLVAEAYSSAPLQTDQAKLITIKLSQSVFLID